MKRPQETETRRGIPGAFKALDPVMQAWTDVKGTLAVISALLDSNKLTVAAAETMRRHIEVDATALDKVLEKAWDRLVRAKAGADV